MRFKLLVSVLLLIQNALAARPITAQHYEKLVGKQISDSDIQKIWDQKYAEQSYLFGKIPARSLAENYHFIPDNARVLDIGMGEGRNAVFLASKGYKVTGIDISPKAVQKAMKLADEYGVTIRSISRPIDDVNLDYQSFDAIVCYYFYKEGLIKKIIPWLKKGGVLIFETYTTSQKNVMGFNLQEYDGEFIRPGELLKIFKDHEILFYSEPKHLGEFKTSIIVKK